LAGDRPAEQQPGHLAQFRVGDTGAQALQQRPAGDGVEAVGDVAAGDPVPSGVAGGGQRLDRGAGAESSPVGVRGRLEQRVDDRVEDVEDGAFDDPVGDGADQQPAESAVGLGDLDRVDRVRSPGAVPQPVGEVGEPVQDAVLVGDERRAGIVGVGHFLPGIEEVAVAGGVGEEFTHRRCPG
jgi:hypothetical protein